MSYFLLIIFNKMNGVFVNLQSFKSFKIKNKTQNYFNTSCFSSEVLEWEFKNSNLFKKTCNLNLKPVVIWSINQLKIKNYGTTNFSTN